MKESLLVKEWHLRRLKHAYTASKIEQISSEVYKAFGLHIVYPKEYNEHAIMVQESM